MDRWQKRRLDLLISRLALLLKLLQVCLLFSDNFWWTGRRAAYNRCVYAMLAEEYNLNYLSLLNCSCLQTEVTQKPTLHKHLIVSRHTWRTILQSCLQLSCTFIWTKNIWKIEESWKISWTFRWRKHNRNLKFVFASKIYSFFKTEFWKLFLFRNQVFRKEYLL